MFLQFLCVCLFLVLQPDPTLERHFKGHRDSVTSVDISYNMKQIGNYDQSFYLIFSDVYSCGQLQNTDLTCLCPFLS